jgi:hypothetical protein
MSEQASRGIAGSAPPSGREQGNAQSRALAPPMSDTPTLPDTHVLHPRTGELIELVSAPPEVLAEALDALSRVELDAKLQRGFVESALRDAMDLRKRKRWAVGAFELAFDERHESRWDGDELERVLRELIDDGVISANEVVDVIRHETTVSRSAAKRLSERLTGSAADAVKRCCSWETKRGRLKVARVPDLNDALPKGDT